MLLITHNGRFHYDEILASAILKKIYRDAVIKRTRNNEDIESGDIIYDVGGVSDPSKCRFDHHQHTFTETYSDEYAIKLSSAGLIWKYYNKEFLCTYGVSPTDEMFDRLVKKIYNDFFLAADAHDNGYNIYGEIIPRTIYSIVNLYNEGDDPYCKEQESKFYQALELVSSDLDRYIKNVLFSWYYKYKELTCLMKDLNDYILVTEVYYNCSLILEVEKDLNKNIFYMVYPSKDFYNIRAVNVECGNFDSKKPLKKEWRGKREDELKDLIEGATFVHASGFIGINKTKEGAIKMCRLSYEEE